jgi:hypothetical protein
MKLNLSNLRRSQPVTIVFVAFATVIAAVILSLPPAANAQPLPVTSLAYSAKFMCGTQTTEFQLPIGSTEYTVIEIHNPHNVDVPITIKIVQDYPKPGGVISPPNTVVLPPNGAMEINCTDIISGFFPGTSITKGFVEILTRRQLKVVAIYKETLAWGRPGYGVFKSAAIAKKRAWPFFFPPFARHSATCICGDTPTAEGDTIRHETSVTLANMSNSPVDAQISIVGEGGVVLAAFPRHLDPNGFTNVTCDNVPNSVPRPFTAGVTVQYQSPSSIAFFECEEIIQKYVKSGTGFFSGGGAMSMAVVEVQPIPVRP